MSEHSGTIMHFEVGVVGAGVIGRGVAEELARFGQHVTLVDTSRVALESARAEIAQGLRLGHMAGARAVVGGDWRAALQRIQYSVDMATISCVDFVIENVTEQESVKDSVHRAIGMHCRHDAVIAANTSAIAISRIAAATPRPESLVGIHFMNPVPLRHTVELIRAAQTSERTLTLAQHLLAAMDLKSVLVADTPGFVANRVLMLSINEAASLLEAGAASAVDIDRVFTECLGHRMGPLATADLIGLDNVLDALKLLEQSWGDKYRPCPLLEELVTACLLGRKSGQGFHPHA